MSDVRKLGGCRIDQYDITCLADELDVAAAISRLVHDVAVRGGLIDTVVVRADLYDESQLTITATATHEH